MTVRVADPEGRRWTVRRGVVRGRDGQGWRWRWRGPDPGWLEAFRLADLANLADIPVIGVVILVIVAVPLVVLALIFLPFVALGVLEAIVLALLFVGLAAAATLFGRPILIRAEREPDVMRVWAVRGWGESRRVRDRIVEALRAGTDPDVAAGAEPVASRGA